MRRGHGPYWLKRMSTLPTGFYVDWSVRPLFDASGIVAGNPARVVKDRSTDHLTVRKQLFTGAMLCEMFEADHFRKLLAGNFRLAAAPGTAGPEYLTAPQSGCFSATFHGTIRRYPDKQYKTATESS